MIISHARKFIFVHNPKCAGTSLRKALEEYHDDPVPFWEFTFSEFFQKRLDLAHLRTWEIAAAYPHIMELFSQYRTISLVRNPYQRFVSSVKEHFRFRHENLAEMTPDKQLERIERFVEHELTVGPVLTNVTYVHFSPQIWFFNLGDKRIVQNLVPIAPDSDFPGTISTIFEIPPLAVKRLNSSTLASDAILSSAKIMTFVEKFYKQDFDFLRQFGHLQSLTEKPNSPREVVSQPQPLRVAQ